MRNIKFRAWNDEIGMRFVDGIHFGCGIIDLVPNDNDFEIFADMQGYSLDKFELMQFTGLLDKNGKEIYEGDIVNVHVFTQELGENLGVCEGEQEFIAIIEIKEYGVYFSTGDVETEGYAVFWNGLHEESFEIIGNVHENPDLKGGG